MNFLHKRLQRAASPAGFERLSARGLPWLAPLAWALLALGTVWGLAFAPMDYQQKNSFRIIYVHVPAAMLSMSVYVMLAAAALVFFVWRSRLAAFFARAAAPYGALMTAIALATGAIWGKPTWGTFWTWDARLTSELILLFLYLAYMLLQASIEEREQADRLAAILAIVGVINIRCCGGIRCIKARRSFARAARPSTAQCCGRSSSCWWRFTRCLRCICCAPSAI